MKVLLTVFCALAILLAGGCVVVAGGELGVISLLNFAIIIPNALMIASMYGFSGPMRPVFIVFAVADVAVALLVGGLAVAYAVNDNQVLALAAAIFTGFMAKAVLSWAVSQRMQRD